MFNYYLQEEPSLEKSLHNKGSFSSFPISTMKIIFFGGGGKRHLGV